MKIALIKETKTPVDNRVALSPKQVAMLNQKYPAHQIVVQSSDIRAFSDEEYKAYIYDFISRDLKVSYNYHMCEAQREKFVKEGKTNKGIFFALKYFYEVKHNDWEKGHGGLGIIPYIYNESCEYWVAQERKTNGIVRMIEQQMQAAAERKKTIVQKQEAKPKFKVDFSVLDELEDEDE